MTVRIFNHSIRVPLLVLATFETVALYLSVRLASMVGAWSGIEAMQRYAGSVAQSALIYSAVLLISLIAFGLYQFHQRAPFANILARLFVAYFVGVLILIAFDSVVAEVDLPGTLIIISTAIALPTVGIIRYVFFRVVDTDMFRHSTLIYGAGRQALSVAKIRRKSDRRGFRICGYVVIGPGDDAVTDYEPSAILLQRDRTLLQLARETKADEIVVALDERRGLLPIDELLECKLNGVAILDLPTFLERETEKIRTDLLSTPSWLIFSSGFSSGLSRRIVKRSTDIIAALVSLIVFSPILIAAVFAIGVEGRFRQSILYRQERIGLHGKPFTLLKLRSMSVDAEADGKARWATKNDSRITRVGRIIRMTRIDELPQLINVIIGDMSFVGPRPERPQFVEELALRIPYYHARHVVLPGITGWAQMRYPYGASVKGSAEKLRYDLYYVKNQNLLFDLSIILQTFEVVIFGKGAR